VIISKCNVVCIVEFVYSRFSSKLSFVDDDKIQLCSYHYLSTSTDVWGHGYRLVWKYVAD